MPHEFAGNHPTVLASLHAKTTGVVDDQVETLPVGVTLDDQGGEQEESKSIQTALFAEK